jgi:hypothetical protein
LKPQNEENENDLNPKELYFLKPQNSISIKKKSINTGQENDLNNLWGGEQDLKVSGFDFIKQNWNQKTQSILFKKKFHKTDHLDVIMKGQLNKPIVQSKHDQQKFMSYKKKKNERNNLKYNTGNYYLDPEIMGIIKKYK